MGLIVVIGQFDIHPEDVAAAGELMRVMMNETIKEPGCHHYAYSRDLSTPNRFQLSELWEDEGALEAHLRADHTGTYRAGLAKLRVQSRTVKRYDVTSAKSL
jgi:quinol monooxygenase YgiN